ncbi:MAG: hypothetical protein LBL66_09800 [Clostridiales bacterium]|nr:hypothetical protein [Clostridiales bacterium]
MDYGLCTVDCPVMLSTVARQSLYKKVRFVFGRDCRVALRAPRNDKPN